MGSLIKLVKLVWELSQDAKRAVERTLAYWASLWRSQQSKVETQFDGARDIDNATRVAVFAHYDRQGQVHDYVLRQIDVLNQAGFCVLFVTNSDALEAESVERLKPLVGKILVRKNIGYDFGAYRDAILSLELDKLDSLVVANDSVYGPFKPVEDWLAPALESDDDVLAITDSWEIHYHFQSYFLLFKANALKKPEFRNFWQEVRYINNKGAVVRRYEVGLTRLLLRLRLNCRALFPYDVAAKLMFEELSNVDRESDSYKGMTRREQDYVDTVIQSLSAGIPLNGTHFLWKQLLIDMGCPFVKRELLAVNPMKVPNLIKFESALESVSDYDFQLIREHLKLVSSMRTL